MSDYQEIPENIDTLYLVKQDLFNGEYILTNHTNNFGKLIYDGLARRTGSAYSAYNSWTFELNEEPFGKREILITDSNSNLTGKAIKGYSEDYPQLIMSDGFKARFTDVSLFSHDYEWTSDKAGAIIHLKSPAFSLTDTINIVDKNIPSELIVLLCFLSEHVLILRRRSRNSTY